MENNLTRGTEELIDNAVAVVRYRDLCEDIRSDEIPDSLDEIERQIERLKQRWGEFTYLIGQRLEYVLEHHLYEKNNYPTFKAYVTIALKMSENNAYYYISVYQYFTEEQTKIAGSKLKLIIPFLNKIKHDKLLPAPVKDLKIKAMRDELYFKIYNKSYRDAEQTIKDVKVKYFKKLEDFDVVPKKVVVKKDRITIFEDDPETQAALLQLINDFYEDREGS